ncbi:MAG: efflux RND transporter periplasmic adaptor subunit [Phycisphaerae bacterium]|nr:efflux RND transporter periplasmic adaptor subunit [Phycisphaerae bacterium]
MIQDIMEQQEQGQTEESPASDTKSAVVSRLVILRDLVLDWGRLHRQNIYIVAGAIAVVMLLWLLVPEKDDKKPSHKPPPVNVNILTITPLTSLEDSCTIPGTVEPNRVVDVAAEVSARVEGFAGRKDKFTKDLRIIKGPASAGMFKKGDTITKGQPILYLNSDLTTARLKLAKAEYEFKERDYERFEKLYSAKVGTNMQLDLARMQRDIARATLDVARANMERSVIVAHISGVLNRLPVEIGEFVRPGELVAEIVDLNTVKVVLDVPERDVGFLKIGQSVKIIDDRVDFKNSQNSKNSSNSKHSKNITGKITYISEIADQSARTTRVEVSVDNRKRILRSGRLVKAELVRRELRDVIMIPLKAVIPLEKQRYVVYLDDGGVAKRQEVTLDMLRDDKVRVTAGLKAGDRLILGRLVGPGQDIRVVNEPDKPVAAPAAEKTKEN